MAEKLLYTAALCKGRWTTLLLMLRGAHHSKLSTADCALAASHAFAWPWQVHDVQRSGNRVQMLIAVVSKHSCAMWETFFREFNIQV
jgi:hypothetical protein